MTPSHSKDILNSWDFQDLTAYGERFRKVVATKAGQSHPLMLMSASTKLDWFVALVSGDQHKIATALWIGCRIAIDLQDESSEMYALSTEEDRAKGKPLLPPMASFGAGEAILKTPGFSWDCFGPNGDKLLASRKAYNYEEHNYVFCGIYSCDVVPLLEAGAYLLAMHYGRVQDAKEILNSSPALYEKLMASSASPGYVVAFTWGACVLQPLQYIFGLPNNVGTIFGIMGLTFDSVEERFDTVTKAGQGSIYTAMEHVGAGGGLFSLKRLVWQAKALCIIGLDVPNAKAIDWLESLPDNETVIALSMTMPHYDHGAIFGAHQACWLALAHEKVGLHDGAVRFADLQLEPDLLKAGNPLTKWPQVIALACKGRVLAKLNRHEEALAAFQAAIATSKESYNLIQMFAYRELSDYAAGGDAAVQAGADLEAKLNTFEGRMSRADFNGLTIGPGPIVGTTVD